MSDMNVMTESKLSHECSATYGGPASKNRRAIVMICGSVMAEVALVSLVSALPNLTFEFVLLMHDIVL